MKECKLYEKQKGKDKKTRCFACEHKCIISEGKTGICAVRKNVDGKLYLTVYGRVISKNVDPIEKKPLYHFLPGTKAYSIGTFGCNFRCGFCQNYDISQAQESEDYMEGVFGEKITPKQIVKEAIDNKCKTIAYTYNEPTIFIEFVKDVAVLAKKKGLKNILVTNGFMTKKCMDFIAPHLDAMNIDLKAFTDDFYKENCKARLKPVLDNIKRAHKKGIHIEITTLLIPGKNDSKKEIEKIAKFIASVNENIPWHISRFFPMYKMLKEKVTKIEKLEQAEKIGKKYLKHVHLGNV
ncbi:AmmeMemoRadiSam system radical SAM enzyme [Candidatus Pacearchaeota archaeon]|nr:AmmeMemoRadiSam system radical SAM enzyme [Candidatus Pacearchaeota archaeon]